MSYRRSLRALLSLLAATTVGGCASQADVDPRELRQTQTAILEARQFDAERFAGPVIREAEERFDLAHDHIDEGREAEALRMLHEARLLAMRAEAESLAQQAVRAAEVVRESLTAMEEALGIAEAQAAVRDE